MRSAGLDWMRAAAILCVLVAHGLEHFTHPHFYLDRAEYVLGDLGVMLFFALSGFLIGGILLRSDGYDIPGFWSRRWLRTLPPYYVALAGNVALAAWGAQAADGDWTAAVFGQDLVHPHARFFEESWSLCIEEAFYLLLPFLAMWFAWVTELCWSWSMGLAAGALVLAPTVARATLGLSHPFTTTLRLDALGYGVLAALAARYWSAWAVTRLHWWAWPCLGLGCSLWFLERGSETAPWAALAYQVALVLLAIGSALVLPLACRPGWWAPRWVLVVSTWSYLLYLANLPFQKLLEFLVGPIREASLAGEALAGLCWVMGCLALAAIGHVALERPVLRWRDRRFPDAHKV